MYIDMGSVPLSLYLALSLSLFLCLSLALPLHSRYTSRAIRRGGRAERGLPHPWAPGPSYIHVCPYPCIFQTIQSYLYVRIRS